MLRAFAWPILVALAAMTTAAWAFTTPRAGLQRTVGRHLYSLQAGRTPPPSPKTSRVIEDELHDLRSEIRVLRNLVQEVCGALVFCADMALREHEMMASGMMYADLNFTATRRPVLLRHTVSHTLQRYGMHPTPIERHWHATRGNSTLV